MGYFVKANAVRLCSKSIANPLKLIFKASLKASCEKKFFYRFLETLIILMNVTKQSSLTGRYLLGR